MRDISRILNNINKKRLERMDKCDHDKLSMAVGLAKLTCEELNRLFTINPLSLCHDSNNIKQMWALQSHLLLYDWVAEYQPADLIDEAYALFVVRKNKFVFQTKLSIFDNIKDVRHIGIPFDASHEPLIMAETIYSTGCDSMTASIVYHTMNEYNCHVGLSLKLYRAMTTFNIYRAMTTFNITKTPLPAH